MSDMQTITKSWAEETIERRGKINYTLGKTVGLTGNPTGYRADVRYSISATQIRAALNSNNIAELRKMSRYFWLVSGEYRRLVSYYAGILTNQILAIPNATAEEMSSPKFLKAYNSILDYIDNSNVEESCTQIELYMVKDGGFFGIERDLNGTFELQVLPSDYCRSRFKIMGLFSLEFDFSFFDNFQEKERLELLEAFPKEFKKQYNAYLNDRTNMRWQLIDPNISRVHIFEDGAPLLASVFLDLIELEEYKAIDKVRSRLGISKLLVHELPVDDEGLPTLLQEEAQQLHQNVYNMITNPGAAIDVISTPAKITSVDLMDKNQATINDIEKATNMIYSTAGTPMVLFNAGAKASSVGLKLSVTVDEALMAPVLKQFEKWYTNRFEQISSSISFKAKFLEITRFNREALYKMYKESSTFGFPTKLATMAVLGIGQREVENLINLENNFLMLPEVMIPTSSSYTQGAEDNEVGNQEKDELTDEGEATRDGDKNANRG